MSDSASEIIALIAAAAQESKQRREEVNNERGCHICEYMVSLPGYCSYYAKSVSEQTMARSHKCTNFIREIPF